MRRGIIALVVLVGLGLSAGWADESLPPAVYARDFYDADSPTGGIQEAVDSLPPEGGQVVLEARTYRLRVPIVLRDNVRLSGQGARTVLTRGGEVIHKLTRNAPAGATRVTVAATEGLRIGDEIAVRDNQKTGWYTTHARITRIQGNTLVLDQELVQDYAVEREALVANHFPMIEALRIWKFGFHVRGLVIEDLTIDGKRDANPTPVSDWSMAAIHLASVADSLVQRVVVRNYPTDGISDQYGLNNVIRDCLVEYCRGNGFHPGTGNVGSRWISNEGRYNDGDGLFFCAGVTANQVVDSSFCYNKGHGIGGIGNGGDIFNVVSGNICRENGRHGLQAADGARAVISNNICLNNSKAQPGRYAGIGLENATEMIVTGNVCGSGGWEEGKPTQAHGIVETGKSDLNIIRGNLVGANAGPGVVTVGAGTVVGENLGEAWEGKEGE